VRYDRRQALDAEARELSAAASGDRDAAARIVDRLGPPILSLARRVLRDSEAAEDVAQEAFLRLWRVAPDWRGGDAMVSTWLHRVAMNLCRDRLRRRRNTVVLQDEHIDDAPGLEDVVHRAQLGARVRAAISLLPPRQRDAIRMCHFQELSAAEAAAALEISVEALESLLARARRALRQALTRELTSE